MMTVVWIVVVLVVAIICAAAGFFARKYLGEAKIFRAEEAANKIIEDAQRQAEAVQREARVNLKDEMHQLRLQTDGEIKERRQELTQLENRLLTREEALDELQKDMARREQSVSDRESHYRRVLEEVEEARVEQQKQLEAISGLSTEQAAEILLKRTEDEVRHDMAKLVRAVEEEARHEGDRRAKDILPSASSGTPRATWPTLPCRSCPCHPTT
jgi:ribonuclease Y